MTLSTIASALLVCFAHAGVFAWFADRTPERKRALRPLVPLVAVTGIVAAIATGLVLGSALHRTVRGTVERKFEMTVKTARLPLLAIREANGGAVDVQVPRELWTACAVGELYTRDAMATAVRCGGTVVRESVTPVYASLAAWATLEGLLVAAVALRARSRLRGGHG